MASISKIEKLRGAGLVFANFSWLPTVPAFKEVNLIYGWNGCGKTTLARLFAQVGQPVDDGLQYEILTGDGQTFTEKDEFPTEIRVFDQDYVSSNLRVVESRANTISILLGAENKDLSDQIEADQLLLNGNPSDPQTPGKLKEVTDLAREKERKERENDATFTAIAKTIGAAISGRTGATATRTYRSPNAKAAFATLAVPNELTEAELAANLLALNQEMLDELDSIDLHAEAEDGTKYEIAESIAKCFAEGRRLAETSVEVEAIERLTRNPDLAEWVGEGVALHEKHNSENCEYCGNDISPERLSQLAKHFNEADKRLKDNIEGVLAQMRRVHTALSRVQAHDEARLYKELRAKYRAAHDRLEQCRTELRSQVIEFGKALGAKKAETGKSVSIATSLSTADFESAVAGINQIVAEHNRTTRDFKQIQSAAEKKIVDHYLSTIHKEVADRTVEIDKLGKELSMRQSEIAEIRKRIDAARAQISSTHAACEKITNNLQTFLGRSELTFVPDTQVVDKEDGSTEETIVGYKIMRGDSPAVRLSEGEKTAIAFVYFVVHLSDGRFRKSDGVVVIDDPVSSLDSNSLYQAFAFLKNAVKGCDQVFVLTHNFDLT